MHLEENEVENFEEYYLSLKINTPLILFIRDIDDFHKIN